MHRFASGLFSLLLIIVIAIAGSVWWLEKWLDRPGPLSEPTITTLKLGTSVRSIARQLADIKAVDNPHLFMLAVAMGRNHSLLKAGEYEFPEKAKPRTIIRILTFGETLVHKLTIPEGLTRSEVMDLIETTAALSGEVETLPTEGSLLPETYHFSRGETRNDLIDRMNTAMQTTLQDLWSKRRADLPYSSPSEALVMASIIEKETGLESERARVAAVFVNRLRLEMPLQSDPTVFYSLTKGAGHLGRPLARSDLKNPSIYNTYVHTGLPPGAIANPGRSSIIAALNPDDSDELYFVADGHGGHRFARTLSEHNRNVATFRRTRAAVKQCVECEHDVQ